MTLPCPWLVMTLLATVTSSGSGNPVAVVRSYLHDRGSSAVVRSTPSVPALRGSASLSRHLADFLAYEPDRRAVVHAAPQQQASEGRGRFRCAGQRCTQRGPVDYVGAGLADLHRVV